MTYLWLTHTVWLRKREVIRVVMFKGNARIGPLLWNWYYVSESTGICHIGLFQFPFVTISHKGDMINISAFQSITRTWVKFPFNAYLQVWAHLNVSPVPLTLVGDVSSRKPRPVSQLVAQQVNQQFAPPSHSKKDKKEKSEKDRGDKEPTLKRKSNKKIRYF